MGRAQNPYAVRTFEFCCRLQELDDPDAIIVAITEEMRWFGYDHVTCWTLPPPGHSAEDGVMMNTRPPAYVERYFERNYTERDPVLKNLGRSGGVLLSWKDVRAMNSLTREESNLIDEASEFSMHNGLVLPVACLSGAHSLFCPCGDRPNDSAEARQAIAVIGTMALATLRRATLDRLRDDPDHRPLTPREREVLQWVSQGKSDDEIADILSISASTVLRHVQNAKRKLDAYKRTSAIIAALRRGEISL
jgi:LuxR family transcriptional regulator, quorum-sensing system regulator BjaR1